MSRSTSRGWAALLLGSLALVASPAAAPAQSLDAVRKAAAGWEQRRGPERQVVDQVCLVPDLPTFLEAISTWDERHYFPILIDDVELTFKFLRAFRPARIVRYPKTAAKIEPETVWNAAVTAARKSWDRKDLGPLPPGVVLSAPDSPTLAGAVALAAGRCQPLLRWETPKRYGDVLSEADAQALARQVEATISETVTHVDQLDDGYSRLGDDCDFITLAGDWPFRYDTKDGNRAFDDLIGRSSLNNERWAYAGRLSGDQTAGVYQAMCSLFLQPKSAVLFNKYSEKDRPWSDYSMAGAVERLGPLLPVTHRSGARAGIAGWHEVFDPKNRYGLVLVNTHGEPTRFHLTDGMAHTSDVPPSVPAIVLIIHSFSAADPANPDTLAGRWLTNGAYVYYGSMNEPYLESFRTPKTVAGLIARHVPLSAAVRQSPPETRGHPWRLLYLGDPLYRIEPDRKLAPRLATWEAVADWPRYVEFQPPAPEADDDLRLNWALKTAVFRLEQTTPAQLKTDLPAVLLGIDRARLHERLRPLYDALLIDNLLQAKRPADLLVRLTAQPVAERSPAVRRAIETIQVAQLQKYVSAQDWPGACAFWDEIARSNPSADLLGLVTGRVGALANSPARLGDWRTRLRSARRALKDAPGLPAVDEELKRVAEKIKPSAAR